MGRSSAAANHLAHEHRQPDQRNRCAHEVHRLESAPGLEWDRAVRDAPQAHLGTASAWFTIIRNAYGHRPLYLTAREDGGGVGPLLLPAFLVRRWPLKDVVTSMPFLDVGGPAGGSPGLVGAALKRLLLEARSHAATQVELRSLSPLDLPLPPSLEKVTLIRQLPADPDVLWRELDAKVRNQIRKAERSGVSVEIGGLERLDEFYRVFAVNMRDLGSPVHSKTFFRQILEAFGPAACVVVARKGTAAVGGLIAISYGRTRYVPWASTLRSHSAFCPNMLMYWETLRRACQDGVARFDFGRSTRGSGTHRFKAQWGATDVQLYWYTVPLTQNPANSISKEDATWVTLSRLWTRLPVFATRRIGPVIRKRLTQ